MKKLTFLLICLLTFLTVFAGEVTEAEALQKAQKFMQVKHFRQQNLRRAQQLETSNAYYIFNVENNGGFVIVAGDDRMTDILGYSNYGSLNPQNVPMNVKWLLRYYQKVASNLSDQPYKTPTSMRSMMPAISPLITTTWDQGAPYNDLCPVYNGHRCITGCVATAMAQVINYNRWPQGPTNIVEAYTSQPSGIEMPQLEPTEFTWDNMTNADISRLMLYCGQAVRMEYGVDASGATPVMIAPALINVFGYSQTTHQVLRSSYDDDGWELLMYNELAEGRPIIYDGQGSGGGHEFVCDGYDGNGLFHINWGWSGNEDGFFALTNLNTGSGDYNSDQSATISIQPPTGNVVNRPKAVVKEVYYGGSRYVSRHANGSFTDISVSSALVSDLSVSTSFQIGYGLYDSDGLQQVVYEENHTFPVGEEYRLDATFAIPSTIYDGTYRIVPICRTDETAKWLATANSSDYYLEIKIEGQWMRLRTFMLSWEERTIVDMGVTIVDGITYSVYNQNDRGRATIISFGDSKPKGVLNIPSQISYKSKDYYVRKIEENLLYDCPDLTSLSLSATYIPYIGGYPNLSTLELREGTCKMNAIVDCNHLESIDFPKSLSTIDNGVRWCSKLKTIRYKNPRQFTFNFYPQWNTESMPALKDVYFASPEPPVFTWKEGNFVVNPNTTIHVPMGSKADYEEAGWRGWNIVDDQPIPEVNGIEWGYCNGDELTPYSIFDECGDNDGEYAIHVPAEMLAPYIGQIISHIQFYQPTQACDYVFITKPGTDYILKQKADVLENAWMDIELSQPYTITGDELYVGVGRHGLISTYFSSVDVSAPDGLWYRAMGADHTQGMEPGTWKYVPAQNNNFEHPIPLKFVISGENLALDVAVQDIHVKKSAEKEDHYDVTMTVQNHSQEVVKSFVVEWDVDGGNQGSKTLEADLLPGRSTEAGFNFEATFPDRYHKLNYQVTKVNGKDDALSVNSAGTIAFASSDTPIEDGVQIVNNVELKEEQLWWKNYDPKTYEDGVGADVYPVGKQLVGIRYHTAIYVPFNLVGGEGTTVDGISIYRNTLAMQNVTVWVSTCLPESEMFADVEILDVPNSQLATEPFRDHQVAFKHSHVIPEGGLYVGYSFDITKDMMNAGYPFQSTNSEKNRKGAFWVKDNLQQIWEDLTPRFGNLRVELLFGGGNFIRNAVKIQDFNYASAVLKGKAQAEVKLNNEGADKVNSISYRVTGTKGNSYEKDANIFIRPFYSKEVTLELDADPVQGYDEKTITITKVNGVSNTVKEGTTDHGTLFTLTKEPDVIVVFEEKTSSSFEHSPVGISVREKVKENYGDKVLPIVIHYLDAMELNEYQEIRNLTNCPVAYVNRKKPVDIYEGAYVESDDGSYYYGERFGINRDIRNAMNQVVPGSVSVYAVWADEDHNKFDINTDTQFEMDADNLPFRLGFVLLEDGLFGEGAGWTIGNYFSESGNWYNDPIFDKWVSMPSQIEGLKFDYVPVAAWSPYKGIEGTIPTSVKAGQVNPYIFRADITRNSLIQDKTKLRAVALLLDKNTGRIINAGQTIIHEPGTKFKLTNMIDDKVFKETMYEYGATITPEPQPEGDYATFEWKDLPQTMPAHDVVVYASYTSGIAEMLMDFQHNIRIYSPNGKKLNKLQKGLNIVILYDGTVKKVIVE